MAAVDVSSERFEQEVIEASKALPVVVDFWAAWCGPCRALGPVLEKIGEEFAGRVKLVKINSDENPELAAAFRVQSIPNVIGFRDGKAVAQFLGAVPESRVRAFFEELLPSAAEEALVAAEAAFAAGSIEEADRLLTAALAGMRPALALDVRIEALKRGIAFARAREHGPARAELEARLATDANDHAARLALAEQHAAERRYGAAMRELLEIVRRDRSWRDGEARKQLLALFTLAAEEAELVAQYRRALANTLH
jgi:putative thioredoxin